MSVTVETGSGASIGIQVTGKLHKDDYAHFVPKVETFIKEHGKIRVLFEMHDFHGWDAGALWEDVKFDVKHFRDIERLAIVGETKWEEGMAQFCRPFTTAQIKYFDISQLDQAKGWLGE